MNVLSNGYFSLEIGSDVLAKGLRKHDNNPRNALSLIDLTFAVGNKGVLEVIEDLSGARMDPTGIDTDNFPWPQLVRLDKHILICNERSIMEYTPSGFEIKISGLTASNYPWTVVSSYDWIYFSNGVVTVIRNPETHVYSVDSSSPVSTGGCNFNGQIVLGVQDS